MAMTKTDTRDVTSSRSLGTKPKPKPVSSSEPDRKTIEKPLPNYLKPTMSSRPNNPVNLTRKNKAVEDNQKLLRRPSSLTSKSTSSSSSHTSPASPRVEREKPVTGLRSTSFHGSKRDGLRGSSTVKSRPVASRGSPSAKTNGLSSSSSSKSKKEGSETVSKIYPVENTPESSPHEDEEIDVQVSYHREEQVPRPDESIKEIEIGPEDASTEEVKEELINEEKTEEEPKEPENTQENNTKDIDDEETIETVALESKAEEEDKAKVEESKSKEGTEETKTQLENLQKEETKKEVVQGMKVSQTVYNDVIASKMQQNSKKNKVLALAGAFQTVIDYETAASK